MGGTAGTADTEAGGNKNMINVPIKIEIQDNFAEKQTVKRQYNEI